MCWWAHVGCVELTLLLTVCRLLTSVPRGRCSLHNYTLTSGEFSVCMLLVLLCFRQSGVFEEMSLASRIRIDISPCPWSCPNFVVSGPKFVDFFAQCGRVCSWSPAFQIFDVSVPSGDIRQQSLRLSEIAYTVGFWCINIQQVCL